MRNSTDKYDCCGCSACVQVCTKQCISLNSDTQGFLYPVINKEICIECGLCEKVCPCENQSESRIPIKVYAAINPDDDIRMGSSSGGVFSLLAEAIVEQNGVVFGARFNDNWEVIHDYTESKEGIVAFRGSKYVQSFIGNTYKQAYEFLKAGRKVLFSGTPCQIAGLKLYLRREYDNLITIDVVCHGVPSPDVWSSYLKYINPEKKKITSINLRDKTRGWKKYSYKIVAEGEPLFDGYASSSLYLQGFSLNLTLRPSCFKCPAKGLKSRSDLTLADCWGIQYIQNIKDDDKGVSAVVVNTQKGRIMFDELLQCLAELSYEFVSKFNPSIHQVAIEPYCRQVFWKKYSKEGINAIAVIQRMLSKNLLFRIYNKIRTKYFQ